MSRALDTWYSFPDLDRLARLGKPLDGEIEVGKLARLSELLSSPRGRVNARMALRHRSDGRLELRLICSVDVELICQRCLEPMDLRLEGSVDYLLTEEAPPTGGGMVEEGSVEMLPMGSERLNPKELIEEELLVSLPLAPRHEDRRACGSLARKLETMNKFGDDGEAAGAGEH